MSASRPLRIVLVPYDRTYLNKSWEWLRDPEIKKLTGAGDFTRADQQAFFHLLPGRADYRIWGVQTLDGEPIGACGIKKITGQVGEIWCYIGERAWWGGGIGGEILELCEREALGLGLGQLFMVAYATNGQSIRAFEKKGFVFDEQSSTSTMIRLNKTII